MTLRTTLGALRDTLHESYGTEWTAASTAAKLSADAFFSSVKAGSKHRLGDGWESTVQIEVPDPGSKTRDEVRWYFSFRGQYFPNGGYNFSVQISGPLNYRNASRPVIQQFEMICQKLQEWGSLLKPFGKVKWYPDKVAKGIAKLWVDLDGKKAPEALEKIPALAKKLASSLSFKAVEQEDVEIPELDSLLAELTAEDLMELNELSEDEMFDLLIEVGILEEGSCPPGHKMVFGRCAKVSKAGIKARVAAASDAPRKNDRVSIDSKERRALRLQGIKDTKNLIPASSKEQDMLDRDSRRKKRTRGPKNTPLPTKLQAAWRKRRKTLVLPRGRLREGGGCKDELIPLRDTLHESIPTKIQVKKLLAQHKIPGQLTGKGQDWTLELPDEKAYKLWKKTAGKTVQVGGYRSGFGSWVLTPGWKDRGDPNDPSSRHHY